MILLASTAYGECRISDVLLIVRPGAKWTLQGNEYAGLQWTDQVQSKPTSQEIQAAITACRNAEARKLIDREALKIIISDKTKTVTQRVNALIDYLEIK
jgi:CHASE3 domain sensor protein